MAKHAYIRSHDSDIVALGSTLLLDVNITDVKQKWRKNLIPRPCHTPPRSQHRPNNPRNREKGITDKGFVKISARLELVDTR